MNDFFKIVLTAGTTLIGGTVLLLLSKIFVEPIQELKKIMGEIAAYVFKSHNLLTDVPNPNENELKITIEKLQEFSAKFRALINTIPWFSLFASIKILRPKDDLLKAAEVLSKISYAPFESDKEKISEQIDDLYKLLDFKMFRQ
jgi:methyl-accepting chemotaxis protein